MNSEMMPKILRDLTNALPDLQPFDKSDYMAFSGVESADPAVAEATNAEGEEYILILDGTRLELHYIRGGVYSIEVDVQA